MAGVMNGSTVGKTLLKFAVALLMTLITPQTNAEMPPVAKWVDTQFQISTLSREQQIEEMTWFAKAAKPFKGMKINIISSIDLSHQYESKILSRAFHEITGVKVNHELIEEDELMQKLQSQWTAKNMHYDAWILSADLIGTLTCNKSVVPLSDFMAGDGKEVTLPTLDLDDFMGKSFFTKEDGKLYQLPDRQFPDLYWFRYDWFTRKKFQEKFKKKYGYDLGIPLNWSAYEDIADFFSNKIQEIGGIRIYGHNDFSDKASQLARRITDTWLPMAGVGDKGIPSGKPVDEWGIREEDGHLAGASVERGGAANSPAAKYALRKFFEWNNKYAPANFSEMNHQQYCSYLSSGRVAQQIFLYDSFLPCIFTPGPTVDSDGTPKWRIAPSPHGPYWENGMKLGYKDCAAWTLLKTTPVKRRKAAWLYAQFCVSKTISLKKAHLSLAPIRESDIDHESFTRRAAELGGLVEFYRSPERVAWTPNGANVPDYPELLKLWTKTIEDVMAGEISTNDALDTLAAKMDKVLLRLSRSPLQDSCTPKLNELKGEQYWLKRPGAPKAKVNEKTQGETIDYDQLLLTWQKGQG